MKQRILITMLIATAMMAGCSKSDSPDTSDLSYELSTTEIGLGAEESITRGDITESFVSGDSFGVHAYYIPEGETITNSTTAYISNLSVDYDGSDWTYSPTKYWPTSGTLSFFAYYPYVEEESGTSISVSKNSDEYPTISFSPNQDVTQQVDFMTAKSYDKDYSNSADGVSFNFEHKLTQIRFSAAHTCESEDVEIKIISITLYANPSASGTFDADGKFSWNTYSEQSSQEDFTISQESSQLISSAITKLGDDGEYTDLMLDAGTDGVMMIPQTLIGESPKVCVTFSYKGATTTTMTFTEDITFDNSSGLPVGASARFKFTIYVNEEDVISISAGDVTVEAWENVELGTETI